MIPGTINNTRPTNIIMDIIKFIKNALINFSNPENSSSKDTLPALIKLRTNIASPRVKAASITKLYSPGNVEYS